MKKTILFLLIILTSGCVGFQQNTLHNPQGVKAYFFSSEKSYSEETPYYDALINLKETYPEPFQSMTVFYDDSNRQEFRSFNISEAPTLLIMKDNAVLLKINGDLEKKTIEKIVKEALEDAI
ncbi:hypothetical protein [Mangrovibacillus cuniculi]|uniref:Small peptidoglycan-associated lipoprotein n=1 Tax=Mangrovibacillus cuniculi TaxID=2593652 RepID=A0A7S8CA30_9BACI|nr:hypothetical protein [Mangrovibacillus cuniculi]QPC46194.1 hypothetical protein G8O30_04090 [Mangrovibacillus cuniculi]